MLGQIGLDMARIERFLLGLLSLRRCGLRMMLEQAFLVGVVIFDVCGTGVVRRLVVQLVAVWLMLQHVMLVVMVLVMMVHALGIGLWIRVVPANLESMVVRHVMHRMHRLPMVLVHAIVECFSLARMGLASRHCIIVI